MTLFALLLAVGIGIGVGVIMGLTGAGGGMLAVPALVYSQGWTMQEASPVALLAVSLGALIGAIDGFRRKQVRYKAASLMALIGAPMTALGVALAKDLSQQFLMAAFSVVLLIVVVRLVRQVIGKNDVECRLDAAARVNSVTGKFDWNWKTANVIGLIGACAGFATGLLGVGGGFIIVPLLRHYTNLSMQSAAATSLMVIALVGCSAVGSALLHGTHLPFFFSLMFAISSVIGVLLGRRVANYLPSKTVQMVFAGMLICVAISFIVRLVSMSM